MKKRVEKAAALIPAFLAAAALAIGQASFAAPPAKAPAKASAPEPAKAKAPAAAPSATPATPKIPFSGKPSPSPSPAPSAKPAASAAASGGSSGLGGLFGPDRLASVVILPSRDGGKGIQQLEWKSRWVEVIAGLDEYQIVAYGTLDARYERKNWTMLLNNRRVSLGSKGKLDFPVPIRGVRQQFRLTAVGPTGEVEMMDFRIEFPSFDQWAADQRDPLKKRHSFSVTGGFSLLDYRETLTSAELTQAQRDSLSSNLSQTAFTAKVSYLYNWRPPRWDLGFTGYINVMPLTSSQPGTTARFLGLNGRVGYVIPGIKEPWRVSLMTGIYFTTMLVTNSSFGFNGQMGPQLFPVVRRMFGNGDTIAGYFKFSPVGSGFALRSLADREIGGGLAWTHRFQGTRNAISVAVDAADLSLLIDEFEIQSKSLSFSVGYAL